MQLSDVGEELARARLGDPRLIKRAQELARATAARPGQSLPRAMGSEAAREGAYRFLSNSRVTLARVLMSHVDATVDRARVAGRVLLISDTTEFRFSTEREGLGVLTGRSKDGFLGHFTLAVSGDGQRTPLGVAALETLARPKRKGQRTKEQRKQDPHRESLRWLRCAEQASERMDGIEAVHVMDREADIYELMAALTQKGRRFIIRSGQERSVDEGLLSVAAASAEMRFSREVKLSARSVSGGPRRTHAARRSRMAHLAVSATTVTLRRPAVTGASELPKSITVNVVRVWEPSPAEGEEAIEWRLFTSESIDTQAQIERIVDDYRARWVIEEFFKALKTGCGFENSQLESRRSLENLLAIYIPVAYQILLLRSVSRGTPDRAATQVLSQTQIAVLRLIAEKPLPADPTVAHVAAAIARLGGHITSNGAPGWQVLGRGFDELRRAEFIHSRIIAATCCDQS
jgi:transposase-like protein/DDE family transposase